MLYLWLSLKILVSHDYIKHIKKFTPEMEKGGYKRRLFWGFEESRKA